MHLKATARVRAAEKCKLAALARAVWKCSSAVDFEAAGLAAPARVHRGAVGDLAGCDQPAPRSAIARSVADGAWHRGTFTSRIDVQVRGCVAVSGDVGIFVSGGHSDTARVDDWLVCARGDGVQSAGADFQADLAAGVDSYCDSLVRSRGPFGDISDLCGLFLFVAAHGDERGTQRTGRLYRCRTELWIEHAAVYLSCFVSGGSAAVDCGIADCAGSGVARCCGGGDDRGEFGARVLDRGCAQRGESL